MIIKIKNKTDSPQQVLFWDGNGIVVQPGQALDIEEGKVYEEELIRLKHFFDFLIEKPEILVQKEIKILSSSKENNGGNK